MKAFFYGCWNGPVHYMRAGRTTRATYREQSDFTESNPWRYEVDVGLCPKTSGYEVEGEAAIHHKDGWTALSFWDRSIDHRHKSNANFLAEGIFNFAEMIEIAKDEFPEIMARFRFPITEFKSQLQGDPT